MELPPHELMEQLIVQQRDLKIMWLHLEEERAVLEDEIMQRREQVRARGREAH